MGVRNDLLVFLLSFPDLQLPFNISIMSHILKLSLVCISIYASLLYLNYNLPVFKQIFAHYFYTETTDFELVKSGFSCMTVNAGRNMSLYERNEYVQLNGSRSGKSYDYKVGGNTYRVNINSYVSKPIGCGSVPLKVYYYDKNPSWSVLNNSFPTGIYWKNLLKSSIAILSVLLITTAIFLVDALKKTEKKRLTFREAYSENRRIYILAIAVLLPFLMSPLFTLIPVFEFVSDIGRSLRRAYGSTGKTAFEFAAMLTLLYLPSVILLSSYPMTLLKKVFSIILFVPVHWVCSRIFEIALLLILR